MTDIEKVLTEMREAATEQLENPTWSDGEPRRSRLRKVLAAFTAEMPGAIGEVVEALKDAKCWCGQLIDRDDCSRCAALAKLEGT